MFKGLIYVPTCVQNLQFIYSFLIYSQIYFVRFDILTKANIMIKWWIHFQGRVIKYLLLILWDFFLIFGKFLLICNFLISEDHIIKVSAYSSHSYIARHMPFHIIRLNPINLTAFGKRHKLWSSILNYEIFHGSFINP